MFSVTNFRSTKGRFLHSRPAHFDQSRCVCRASLDGKLFGEKAGRNTGTASYNRSQKKVDGNLFATFSNSIHMAKVLVAVHFHTDSSSIFL